MKSIFISKNNQLRSGWKIIMTLLLTFFIIPFILGMVLFPIVLAFGIDIKTPLILSKISMYIQEVLTIIVPLILWKLIDKKSLTQLGFPSIKNNHKNFIYGLLIGAFSLTAVTAIILCTNSAVLQGSILKPSFSLPVLEALILYIFVGFAEEIFCRGYCLSVLKQCRNKYVPYVGSAVIFALMHSFNPGISFLAYINLFLFGLLLSYVVYKTKNIWFGIGLHITWNFFEGNVWGFLVSGTNKTESIYTINISKSSIINGGAFGPEGGLAVTAILILLILMIYKFVSSKES